MLQPSGFFSSVSALCYFNNIWMKNTYFDDSYLNKLCSKCTNTRSSFAASTCQSYWTPSATLNEQALNTCEELNQCFQWFSVCGESILYGNTHRFLRSDPCVSGNAHSPGQSCDSSMSQDWKHQHAESAARRQSSGETVQPDIHTVSQNTSSECKTQSLNWAHTHSIYTLIRVILNVFSSC